MECGRFETLDENSPIGSYWTLLVGETRMDVCVEGGGSELKNHGLICLLEKRQDSIAFRE